MLGEDMEKASPTNLDMNFLHHCPTWDRYLQHYKGRCIYLGFSISKQLASFNNQILPVGVIHLPVSPSCEAEV